MPATVVVGVCGLIVVLTYLFFQHRAEVDRDASVVFCLAPDRRGELIDAADALRMARPVGAGEIRAGGVKMDLEMWQERFPDDFARACDALSGARRPPGAGLLATVLPFLTGLVGAGVAFVAAAWRDRVARGRLLAVELRNSYGEFQRAVEAFLVTPIQSRDSAAVKESRAAVLTQLALARVVHPRWRAVDRARTKLTDGDLGMTITVRWTDRDESRESNIRQALSQLQDTMMRISNALEKPLRSRWYMLTDRGEST